MLREQDIQIHSGYAAEVDDVPVPVQTGLVLSSEEQDRADVYGETFRKAKEQMELLAQEIMQRSGVGFTSVQECAEWAHNHVLDRLLYSPMTHRFFNVSHKGEIISDNVFQQYYGSILFYRAVNMDGNEKRMTWTPNSFIYYDKASIPAEQSDGVHSPLYFRSYVKPTGYYDPERGAFNVAKPFPVYARNTGRDTSHIYALIEHIAGECAMWLLAWLRAKLIHPTVKTQVVPIIVSRAQGSGKTTFAEVICKGLFGKDNVLVSDQYDASARFNADYADALIVCLEEKEEIDKRNTTGSLKSRATATTIRKEQKGIDPIYQESYTDFIMTTNKDVPVKFDGREDQRRFMVMEADDEFTRKNSEYADEVFTKLYGYDANYQKVGTPFVEDRDLIAQFKHELFTRSDIAAIQLRKFPKTAAYKRCFTLPRTTEASEIESILRAIAPFLRASLDKGSIVQVIDNVQLEDIISVPAAVKMVLEYGALPKHVALCRPLVFFDNDSRKPFQHSTVERGLYDAQDWLAEEYGLALIPDMDPLIGGFPNVPGRYRMSPAARICLKADVNKRKMTHVSTYIRLDSHPDYVPEREGYRFRVNNKFIADNKGCYETVNEMKDGILTLQNKTQNVQYMDTFLLESDDGYGMSVAMEEKKAAEWILARKQGQPIAAEFLYAERLKVQKAEASRLFNEGTVCRVVYSGAKSIHMLVRVADAPSTLEEYKWLHAYLCSTLSDKLVFDSATNDPARLTRSPVTQQRITTAYACSVKGTQCLLLEDWSHIYNVEWRNLYESWKNRPMADGEKRLGRKLYPCKPEYTEAMLALVDGTFWTDEKWNGRRQDMFFVAYRMYRSLGYSHEQLWTEDKGGILYNLDEYYHPDDIQYWKTRESSRIIAEIDADIDANMEDEDEE